MSEAGDEEKLIAPDVCSCKCTPCCPPKQSGLCPCCCCCFLPLKRIPETILLVFISVVALGCYCFNIIMWFGVAVNQNILAPIGLLLAFILFLGWLVSNSMSQEPAKYTSVAAGMALTCMFMYIIPLLVNFQLTIDLPDAMSTSFTTLPPNSPPSPALVPFAYEKWLFNSFPATGPGPSQVSDSPEEKNGFLATLLTSSPNYVFNKTSYAYKTNIVRRDATTSKTGEHECGSFTRDWSDELLMDVYLPTNRGVFASTPVLFHVHGGAWRVGDKSVSGWSFHYFLEVSCVAKRRLERQYLSPRLPLLVFLESLVAARLCHHLLSVQLHLLWL